MNQKMAEQPGSENEAHPSAKRSYHAPHLIDYGAVSELTAANPGPGVGDDGATAPSSYAVNTTAS